MGHSQDRRSDCRQILIALVVTPEGVKVSAENFQYRFNAQSEKKKIYRDGTCFLRTNQTDKGAVELWQQSLLQTNVEQAFNELKSDLSIRPIRHHLEERVEAHVFIAFMSDCLQMTLRQKLRQRAPGLTSRAALELFSKIKRLKVTIPTADHRTIHLQRYTPPEMEHKILLDKLKTTLPRLAPPKIYADQYKK